LPHSRYCGVPAHQELATKEAELPADAPADTPLATQEEVEQAEPVARVKDPADEVAVVTEAPNEEVLDEGAAAQQDEPVPAVPVGPTDGAAEQLETPVEVTGGAGLETTLDGHETTAGEPPAAGQERKAGEEGDDGAA
jgi:hypothetical protein